MSRAEASGGTREGTIRAGDQAPRAGREEGAESRLLSLMKEFEHRQRRRPELVVRPWWTPTPTGDGGAGAGGEAVKGGPEAGRPVGAIGFVVEYCPRGVESAELAVRVDRVRVEGPAGVLERSLDLGAGWWLDGEDRVCPETLANHLLRLADGVLG